MLKLVTKNPKKAEITIMKRAAADYFLNHSTNIINITTTRSVPKVTVPFMIRLNNLIR